MKTAQCTECQWIGDEKDARIRNRDDEQIEWKCPKCKTLDSIVEVKEKRYTACIKFNIWDSTDKGAKQKALKKVCEMIECEDNDAVLNSLIEHQSGSMQTREITI